MLKNTKVKIPKEKAEGRLVYRKRHQATYVLYTIEYVYKKEKKYAVPKRAIIGKVCEDDDEMMYPNDNYVKYFGDDDIPEELPEETRSCCLKIGSYAMISRVIDEYGLRPMLEKRFGKDAGLILDLVAYMIIDEKNAGQYYPEFAFNHPLFSDKMRIYSDSKVSRLLGDMSKDQFIGFLDDWNRKRDHKSRIYISYDSTNKNSEAGDIDIVEFGKAKDDKGLPIFNLSIAMDKTNQVPLFYEEYPGSINDVSQFGFMVDKVISYGYRNIGFILDRGYFGRENIKYMDKNGYSFIMMVRGCKPLVSELVLDNLGSFEYSRDASIRSFKVHGKTVKHKLFDDDEKERYFHIYFNSSKMSGERERLERNLDIYSQYLEQLEGTKTEFGRIYHHYFNLHYDKGGTFIGAEERSDVIEKEMKLCGYFCIVTSEKMTASQAMILYKGRDISEELFRNDKTFLGARSERVASEESMSSKIFIEFIALIIRNRIYNLLKENMIRLEKKHNYMTVPAAIRELEKIEMVRINGAHYKLDHAVTKTQKIILSSFGLDEKDIRETAKKISELMAEGYSLMDREEEAEDGTEEIY